MNNIKEFFNREKQIALTAQPRRFRIGKWIGILILMIGLILWRGWLTAITVFLLLALIGTCFHFLLRWKTKGWTQSWGPYKKIN